MSMPVARRPRSYVRVSGPAAEDYLDRGLTAVPLTGPQAVAVVEPGMVIFAGAITGTVLTTGVSVMSLSVRSIPRPP